MMNRFIHRDVKPENILLGQNDELLLSDFGIARLPQRENTSEYSTSHAAGTPYYMAPEQIEGKACRASDQYALAIMVYEWLCGQPPFRGSDARTIQRQHIHDSVPPLHKQLPISSAVERVVLTALAKEPEKRFDSVRAFAAALESVSTIQPAPKQSELVTPGIISRRAVLLGTGGVVGLVLLGAVIWSERKKTYSPPQGKLYLTYRGYISNVYSVAWSPDGKHIASSDSKAVQVWDVANGGNLFIYRGSGGAIAWSPNGKRIASASADGIVVWDAANGGNVFTYKGSEGAIAWSPDGKRIASASSDRTVQVWDAANGGNVITYRGYTDIVWGVAWSPDGKHIASGSFDRTAQVWDAVNGSHIFIYRGHSNHVTAVAWSPDSQRIASASFDATVQVWQAV